MFFGVWSKPTIYKKERKKHQHLWKGEEIILSSAKEKTQDIIDKVANTNDCNSPFPFPNTPPKKGVEYILETVVIRMPSFLE